MNRHNICMLICLCVLAACTRTAKVVDPPATASIAAPAINETTTAQTGSTPQAAPVSDTGTPATTSGRMFIDPVTGQPRVPTADELASEKRDRTQAQTQSASSASRPAVTVTELPGGVTQYDFGTASQVQETACLRPDGSFGECTPAQLLELRAKASQLAQ